jgi:malonate-semialdehyde dehydrogenase (acetylating)/methylmalonate-semialdehyde dehydrogenase
VGSTPTGKNVVYKKCGETGKRVIAGCGAKNCLVIMPDAVLDPTIAGLMTSIYGNAGQRCLAGTNVIIVGEDESFYQRFRDAFIKKASKIKVGYGLDESVQMGPVRDKGKKERIVSYIEKGIKEGAKLTLDGRKVSIVGDYPDTCFLGPTLFEEVNPDMTIAREEIFGPVATFMKAKTLDKAIDIIHNIPFGNSAGIFTQSGKWAREFQYNTECGNIGINVGIAAPMAFFPFSGMKDSFFGDLHPQGQEVIRFFTESKVVIQRWL